MTITPTSPHATIQSMTIQVSFDVTAIAATTSADSSAVNADNIARTLRNTQLGEAKITDALEYHDGNQGVTVDVEFTENPSDILAGSIVDQITQLIVEEITAAPVAA